MAKIVFRVVLFSKRRKCTVCGRERRFGCEQVGIICFSCIRRLFGLQVRLG